MSQAILRVFGCSFVVLTVFWCSRVSAQDMQKEVTQKDLNETEARVKLKFCEALASLMQKIAIERDKGTPLSELYLRLPDTKYFPREANLKAAKFIYANPEESPSDVRQVMLDKCYKQEQ